ncbi:hypothetical protein [Phenylobacterium sp.]|uniref:hypothetical protein n=1 Tax=Phenylobacterium sp. TaxID=1871053 RepID=UPI0037C780EF
MTEMLERVRRAIEAAISFDRDMEAGWGFMLPERQTSICRAVLHAMREPTDEMAYPRLTPEQIAMLKDPEADYWPNDGSYFDFHRADDAAGIWRAMMARALGEHP